MNPLMLFFGGIFLLLKIEIWVFIFYQLDFLSKNTKKKRTDKNE